MRRSEKDTVFSHELIQACLDFETNGYVDPVQLETCQNELALGATHYQSMHDVVKAVYREYFLRAWERY